MPSIRSIVPRRFGDEGDALIVSRPCVACTVGTQVLAETPFRPDLGAVPLHLTCGAALVQAYMDVQAGRELDDDAKTAIARLQVYQVEPPRLRLLLLTAHSIAEYDDVRMFTDMGVDVFSIGAYSDPANPGDSFRPPLPVASDHPELRRLVIEQREKHAGQDEGWAIDWAKADLHPDLIDWADVIVAHHYLDRWIVPQFDRMKHKRVVWRTCGQSDPRLEQLMAPLRRQGLQIVRYSPAERRAFEQLKCFAGEDALIRFGKYPEDYGPWTGEDVSVANITQNMAGRGDACGLRFWLAATDGLRAMPAGPGSEQLPGGRGALDYDQMLGYLRRARTYLYTGTTPASYTLGLIEAMLSGTPVVSIGPNAWMSYGPLLEYEVTGRIVHDTPDSARADLVEMLRDPHWARMWSEQGRDRAIELFDIATVSEQWASFLGIPVRQAVSA